MGVIHKKGEFKGLWESWAMCGVKPIVLIAQGKWRGVTCKNCLRLKRK